jgi:hypothetical protein
LAETCSSWLTKQTSKQKKKEISLQFLGARQNLGTDLSYTKVGRLM